MIRILLVDDQNLVQQGIKSLLDQDREFKVVGSVRDGKSAIKQIDLLRPDIVLLDIEMPGMNGISVTKYINHFLPETKVIILSSHEDKKYLVQALVAGAKAYILKNSLMTDLKQAIVAVNNGYSQIESRLLAKVINSDNIKSARLKPAVSSSQDLGHSNSDREKLSSLKKTAVETHNKNSSKVINNSDGETIHLAKVTQVTKLSNSPVSSTRSSEVKVIEPIKSEQKTKIQSETINNSLKSKTLEGTSDSLIQQQELGPKITTPRLNTYDLDRHGESQPTEDIPAYDLSEPTNENALVPISASSFSQRKVTFGSNLKKPEPKTTAIRGYLQQITNQPEIRRLKLEILKFSQPIVSEYYPVLRKYESKLVKLTGHKNAPKWLKNIGLMFIGGIIVLILHGL